MKSKQSVRLIAFITLTSFALFLTAGCATVEDSEVDLNQSDEPVPYEEDEFPQWAKDLRRGEIIFAGSLPFTILASNAGYGIYKTITGGSGGLGSLTGSSALTDSEKFMILGIGAGISAALAITDWIIGLVDNGE